jgi:hypothetical protein
MDVNGARALARRFGPTAPPGRDAVSGGVSELAPPVYHWFGIDQPERSRVYATSDLQEPPSRLRRRGRLSLRRRQGRG